MHRTSTHILLVEDNPGDVLLLRKMLQATPQGTSTIHAVPRLSDGMEYLRKGHADAVILDLGLPDSTGLSTFHAFQARHPDLPIIVLTELNDQEIALQVLRSGGQDYLIKGQINNELLSRSIRYAIERKQLELKLRKAKQETEEAARTLEESEQRFRSLFENSPVAIFITQPGGTIISANSAATEIFGWTNEEICRLGRAGLIEDNPELVSALEERERTGRIHARPLTAIRKNGERFPVEIDSVILPNKHQNAFVMMRDISERKRHEDQLKALAAGLEEKVRERTEELKSANRAKDEFLANMSHEIRTPLAGVFGITEVLLGRDLPGPVRDDLELVRSSSESVLFLLNDLLDLARVEQGKLDLHMVSFDIRTLVKNLVPLYTMQAERKGIVFQTSLAPDLPQMVVCDPDRLAQVIKNLLSNAVKFTEHGRITLDVRPEKVTEHLARIRFTVSDTGIGIPEVKVRTIFQAFTQADPTYSKKFAGAGLGLAITKMLVELMGGEVNVQSELGIGSTFSFTIGFEKAEPQVYLEQKQVISLSDLPPLTILLAEDNPVNRLFLRRAFTQAGHRVVEAENGAEVLHKLYGNTIDMVLMDIQMPEMDGIEATRRIRSGKHGRADIPIIALTAYAMKGDREKFLEKGMDGYVTKPVDFGELARTIRDIFQVYASDPRTSEYLC
jgi:PAS domain S-box-containing protein